MRIIHTEKAPAALGPYSQGIEANGTLYVSGQIPFVPETMTLVSDDVKAQTRQSLENVKAIKRIYLKSIPSFNLIKCTFRVFRYIFSHSFHNSFNFFIYIS